RRPAGAHGAGDRDRARRDRGLHRGRRAARHAGGAGVGLPGRVRRGGCAGARRAARAAAGGARRPGERWRARGGAGAVRLRPPGAGRAGDRPADPRRPVCGAHLHQPVPAGAHRSGGAAVSGFLLAFGAATAVGVLGGGWAADRGATRALVLGAAALVGALGLLHLVAAHPVPVAAGLVVWGVVGMGLVPSLQYRVLELAGPGRDLAATLPASALNAGIALGALAGGWALDTRGAGGPLLTGLLLTALAVPAAWATSALRPPTREGAAP